MRSDLLDTIFQQTVFLSKLFCAYNQNWRAYVLILHVRSLYYFYVALSEIDLEFYIFCGKLIKAAIYVETLFWKMGRRVTF